MAEFPSLPLWTDAFLADTMHLDAKETGAYLMLIISAWRSPDCTLPNDDKKLARMARCSPREWKSIKEEVLSFWDLEKEKLSQKKLIKVRQNVEAKSAKASTAAKAKWLKDKGTGDADADNKHMPDGCQPKPKPKPEEKYKKEWEEFWKMYPKKISKSSSKKAFYNALKKTSFENIMEGLKDYIKYKPKDIQFAHASSWLNQERWEDEYESQNEQQKSLFGNAKQLNV